MEITLSQLLTLYSFCTNRLHARRRGQGTAQSLSLEKINGKHHRRKVEKSCATFLLCDPDWCVDNKSGFHNKWDDNTHTQGQIFSFCSLLPFSLFSRPRAGLATVCIYIYMIAGTFNVPTSYQQTVGMGKRGEY